ncbi:uncharacterized protein [Diadema antillarum]|uniref:uncharacterized protein n=1 Tax=Diadema antillarum TaxID=105358 RepID=UPI003A8A36F7
MSATDGSKIFLWCVPRVISSAFAKCLSAIPEMEIYFEPFLYCNLAGRVYKKSHGEDLPLVYKGNEEVLGKAAELLGGIARSKMESSRLAYSTMKETLESTQSKYVFVKDMASGVASDDTRKYLPSGFKYTFLIRDPIRSISSYRKAMFAQFTELGLLKDESANEQTYDVERDDILFPSGCYVEELYDLWKYVKENIDSDPIVIDADDLLTKPAEYLKAYCDKVGLPYTESLLKWEASTESLKSWKAAGDNLVLDVVNFYGSAMRSSEFFPPSRKPDPNKLTRDVRRCADKVMKFYNEMAESKLKL